MMKRFIVYALCYIGALTAAVAEGNPEKEFFLLCSGGKAQEMKEKLEEHPEWANAKTSDGESCLHLAAIPGSSELTKVLLDAGADPNVRSTFEEGLRMHPLSWNAYGGHADSIKLLLEKGASVNADFDYMVNGRKRPITALDIVLTMLRPDAQGGDDESNDDLIPFRRTRDILLQHGAKTYDELHKNDGDL